MMGKGWHPWTTGTSNQPLPSLSSDTNLPPFLSPQPLSKRYWVENSSVPCLWSLWGCAGVSRRKRSYGEPYHPVAGCVLYTHRVVGIAIVDFLVAS